MIRSVKYKLHPNQAKGKVLDSLLFDFQRAVNHYVQSFLSNTPDSRKNCYKGCESNVLRTKRLEDNAAQVAYDVITSWSKGPKKRFPEYFGGIRLNAKNVQIQSSRNSFDRWLYIQPHRLYLPFNLYRHKWLKGKELKEVTIIKKNEQWYLKVSYEVEQAKIDYKTEVTSIDVGINKLMTTPRGEYGSHKLKRQIKCFSNRLRCLRRRNNKLGTKSPKRLRKLEDKFSSFLKNSYNREVNKLIEQEAPKQIVVEDLNIKGTKGKRSRAFNNRVSRSGLNGIKKNVEMKCEEYGIQVHRVNPAYTSQTCPACGHVDSKNRQNEKFKCRSCNHEGDADQIASINILRTFLRKDWGDKANDWWPLEFHHGGERLPPKSRTNVLPYISSG